MLRITSNYLRCGKRPPRGAWRPYTTLVFDRTQRALIDPNRNWKNIKVIRRYLESELQQAVETRIKFASVSSLVDSHPLYYVTKTDFINTGGEGILVQYNEGIANVIMGGFVEMAWKPWMFIRSPRNWWPEVADLVSKGDPVGLAITRDYLETMATIVSPANKTISMDIIKSISHYSDTERNRLSLFGSYVQLYNRLYSSDSVTEIGRPQLLNTSYPVGFWWDAGNRRTMLESLFEQTNRSYYDYYNVTQDHLRRMRASVLLKMFNGSVALMVATEFPEHYWQFWKFQSAPHYFWNSLSKQFFELDAVAHTTVYCLLEQVAKELHLNNIRQLTEVEPARIDANLLWHINSYLGGLSTAISTLFFHQELPPSPRIAINHCSQSYRELLDTVKHQLGQSYDSLYNGTMTLINRVGGKDLIAQFRSSASLAIMVIYPEHTWKPWCFKYMRPPPSWWKFVAHEFSSGNALAEAVIREYVDDIGRIAGVSKLEDWYHVPLPSINSWLAPLTPMFSSIFDLLVRLYPHHRWPLTSPRVKKSKQRKLKHYTSALIPKRVVN